MSRRSRYGRRGFWEYGGFPPYVPVAERRREAARAVAALAKKGQTVQPIRIEGRAIARTFWGKAWCDNLEAYSDFENRLPRGRTYVRNGSVVDLQIKGGKVTALVQGSSLYDVEIDIHPVAAPRWRAIVKECAGKIDSVVELLSGKLSGGVMEIITRKETGLFPAPREIQLRCSCPDGAVMCKHVAAVLYGVGARLDHRPELLFELRSSDPTQLVTVAATGGALLGGKGARDEGSLAGTDLSALFGVDIEQGATKPAPRPARTGARAVPAKDERPPAKRQSAGETKLAAKATPAAGTKPASREKPAPKAQARAAAPAEPPESATLEDMVAQLRSLAPSATPEDLIQIVALAQAHPPAGVSAPSPRAKKKRA